MAENNLYDTRGLYEPAKKPLIFKLPRVVPDQRYRFETDELFRRLSRETQIQYTNHPDKKDRLVLLQKDCHEGKIQITFLAPGITLDLAFNVTQYPYVHEKECEFDQEPGKVHIKSYFIMNGVCVRFRGWIALEGKLEGMGCLEYDECRAMYEDAILRENIDRYNQRLRRPLN